ncbi:hypothetical protein J3R30DRAFT_3735554 [Lentinula aciculospora]|uniref:Uncharacterized protein n=1 Tax=Lentinula aciculospora TaxID=153920 RepID=A0A9W9DKZ9_9AGAR|nr:hypothetical protein J3R30DRAFT_3735554 [Lentinula aciculospora]
MPSIITPSRQKSQQMNPSLSSYSTPSRLHRALSPPASISSYTAPTITPLGAPQRLNVVNRIAIEGKAKQDEDNVSIKMYLKMSLPLDSLSPGSTVQLFPEENVKILSSQVHPLDSNSVPYNFDSTVSPLLNRAARALKLPERSKQTFPSAFNLASPESSTVVDVAYTGHILVSNYYISYVLPKHFPPEASTSSRSSLGERSQTNFMAAIDMVVPYISRPPRSPYLLSIPTPRCLDNNISLRIFSPSNPHISSSFASLSSTDNEESGSWDLASEPPVTRGTSSRSRSNSYNNNFADDESSDSSTVGFSYGCGIRGKFISTERIRVRWAKPMKSFDADDSNDGRRRVGVKDVKGEMTCVIRGKEDNGVLMDVTYKGTCKGVWFPGVATMLGMDVGLVAKNSEVTWAEGHPNEWQVTGGTGYTGFDIGLNQKLFRHESIGSNSRQPNINVLPSTPNGEIQFPRASGLAARQDSTSSIASSTSSLLRAPLPTQNVADYSFEGSPAASGTLSSNGTESLSSLPASISNLTSQSQSRLEVASRVPEHPVTLHLNMNELLPASRNNFIFGISGTIVVSPRPTHSRLNGNFAVRSNSEGESDSDDSRFVTLPRFTVHAADSESISVVVKNDMTDGGIVDVYNNSVSSSSSLIKGRPSQLKQGAITKYNNDIGVQIALKHVLSPVAVNGTPSNNQQTERPTLRPPPRPLTPNGSIGSRSSSPIKGNNRVSRTSLSFSKLPHGTTVVTRPVRDSTLMIPWVSATVTPLLPSTSEDLPESYAVRLNLPAPADADSEWLEFGLAKPGTSTRSNDADHRPPKINLVNASVEGVPVRFETTAATATTSTQELDLVDLGGIKFGEMSTKEWISWIRVRVGGAGGSTVVVDYVVKTEYDAEGKTKGQGKRKVPDEMPMDIYLPSFSLPVGRLEVVVDAPGLKLSSLRTNLRHSSSPTTKRRFLHYSTEEFFYPHLSFHICPDRSQNSFSSSTKFSLFNVLAISTVLIFLTHLRWRVYHLEKSFESYSLVVESGWNDTPQPITVTTTVYSYENMKWSSKSSGVSEVKPTLSLPMSIPASPSLGTVSIISTPTLSVVPSNTRVKSTASSRSSLPRPSSTSSLKETFALIPMQSVWNFQWQDLKPVVESTAKVLKRTLGPVWKILELVWWGPE